MYIVLPLSLSSDWNILLNVVNEPNTTEHRIRQSWTCGWGYFEFHCKDVGWDKRKCPWDGLAGSSSGTCETYCCLRPCVQKYLSLHWHPPKLRVQCSIVRALIFLTLNLCFVSEVPWDSEEWFGGLKLFLRAHSTFAMHIDDLLATHLPFIYQEITGVLSLHGSQWWEPGVVSWITG